MIKPTKKTPLTSAIVPFSGAHEPAPHISDVPGKPEGDILCQLYVKAEMAQAQLIGIGLYAFGIKSKLPHGAFGGWLHANAPHLAKAKGAGYVPSTALSSYMNLASSVLEAMGVQLTDWFPGLDAANRKLGKVQSPLGLDAHQLLLFPEAELDTANKILRARLHEIIAGQSRKALVAKVMTVKESVDESGDVKLLPATGAGVYHLKKKDGGERMKKRTYAQKQLDDALAKVPGWLHALRQFALPDSKRDLALIPATSREQLKLAAYDAYQILLEVSKLP